MLTNLKLHNYRTYLNAEITLGRTHLLIGRNNSGKTNLASAIRFLSLAGTADLAAAGWCVPGGVAEMRNWHLKSAVVELSSTCEIEFEGQPCRYTYNLSLAVSPPSTTGHVGQVELKVKNERLSLKTMGFADIVLLESDGHQAKMLHEEHFLKTGKLQTAETLAPRSETMLSRLYELGTNRRAIFFRQFLSGWAYYQLSPEAMRNGWRTTPVGLTALDPRAEFLSYAILSLKTVDEMQYRRVIEHARLIEPELDAINFSAISEQSAMPFVARRNQVQTSWAGLSDGTLRALALAYIIELSGASGAGTGQPPRLSIIEEPENGIYPGQLRTFFDLFEERAPGGQFIFTSHSPYFINMFDATRDCVTILKRSGDRTEIMSAPPLSEEDESPDRLTLAEKYAAELIG